MEDDDEFEYEFDENDEIESEQVIGYLISAGAAEWDGIDDDGERVFKFNMNVLRDILPELYDQIMDDLDNTMMELYQKGLAELEYDEELNAHFKVSEAGKALLQSLGYDYFLNDENDQD